MFGCKIATGLRLQRICLNQIVRWSPRETSCLQIPQPRTRICGQRFYSQQIVEGTEGTHKPTPFQKRILVWTKTYPSIEKIPDRVKRLQMKKAMDKFRVKASIYMVAMTFLTAAIVAFIGRKARHDGMSVRNEVLERREKLRQEGLEQNK